MAHPCRRPHLPSLWSSWADLSRLGCVLAWSTGPVFPLGGTAGSSLGTLCRRPSIAKPFQGPQGSALHPCCHGPLSELRACDQLHDLAAPGKGFLPEQDHSCLVPCGVHGRTPGGMAVLTAFCRVTTVDESMRVCHRSAVLRLPPLPTKPSELWGDPSSSGDGEADVVQRTQGPH